MEDDLKTRIKAWVDSYYAETEGYTDPDYLYDVLMTCGVKIELATKRIEEYAPQAALSRYAREVLPEYQKKLEWGHALSAELEEQLARFPPLPVLPPTAPLIKLSGVVDEVEFTKGMVCFDAEVYTTVRDELERKRQRDNIGALVAMSAQMLAGSPPHAMIRDGELNKQKSLHVKGKVDGKSFAGWFGMTDIRPGDYVEMAAMPDNDGYLIYAIASPKRRTVSFVPRCDFGNQTVNIKQSIVIWLIAGLVVYIPSLMINPESRLAVTVIYLVACYLLARFSQYQIRKQKGCIMRLFDEICDVLMPEHKRKGLRMFSKRKAKLRKKEGQEKSIVEYDADIRPLPHQSSDYIKEYFFYY